MTLFRCDKGAETEYTSNKIALKKRDLFGKHTNMHTTDEQVMNNGSQNILEATKVLLFTLKGRPCSIAPLNIGRSGKSRRQRSAKADFASRIRPVRLHSLPSFASIARHDQSEGNRALYAMPPIGKHATILQGHFPFRLSRALPRSA